MADSCFLCLAWQLLVFIYPSSLHLSVYPSTRQVALVANTWALSAVVQRGRVLLVGTFIVGRFHIFFFFFVGVVYSLGLYRSKITGIVIGSRTPGWEHVGIDPWPALYWGKLTPREAASLAGPSVVDSWSSHDELTSHFSVRVFSLTIMLPTELEDGLVLK